MFACVWVFGLACTAEASVVRPKAFPSASGYGASSMGGRGGKVVYVTNLNDKGPGSLRWAAEDLIHPRIILFNVSGIIELAKPITIRAGRVTIAGQSAPPGGITLKNFGMEILGTNNVIIRYLRIRPGGDSLAELPNDLSSAIRRGNLQFKEADALNITASSQVIIDHCSFSWSTDELVNVLSKDVESTDITLQWNIFSEALHDSNHPPHPSQSKYRHSCGTILVLGRNSRYSVHHNLYAHNASRNPVAEAQFRELGGTLSQRRALDPADTQVLDFFDNAIYNWGYYASHAYLTSTGGEEYAAYDVRVNYLENLLIPGPDTISPFAIGSGVGSAAEAAVHERRNGQHTAHNTLDTYGEYYTPYGWRATKPEFLALLRQHKAFAVVPRMRLYLAGNEIVGHSRETVPFPLPRMDDEFTDLIAPDVNWATMTRDRYLPSDPQITLPPRVCRDRPRAQCTPEDMGKALGEAIREISAKPGFRLDRRFVPGGLGAMAAQPEKARTAVDKILQRAGAVKPERDAVDRRVIGAVQTCLSSGKPCEDRATMGSIINSQKDIGSENDGFPVITPIHRCNVSTPQQACRLPYDADEDGIPDSEGLSAGQGFLTDQSTGYTRLELYLNRIAGD